VKEALDACGFHACTIAVAGTMAAHYERGTSGKGQHVDVSVQEGAFSRGTSGIVVWQFDSRKLMRSGDRLRYGNISMRCIWALKDGYCFHSLMSGRLGAPANSALSKWMDDAGFDNPMRDVDWLAYNRSTLPQETRNVWEAAIDRFFRSVTRAEVASEGRRRGINASVGQQPEDILSDPHLRARGYWREFALEDGKVVEIPAYFVKGAL
jgi:crotonobetainyl-CoA:carnitine CoA-transferase CaiB-like acyl-CoA transferase